MRSPWFHCRTTQRLTWRQTHQRSLQLKAATWLYTLGHHGVRAYPVRLGVNPTQLEHHTFFFRFTMARSSSAHTENVSIRKANCGLQHTRRQLKLSVHRCTAAVLSHPRTYAYRVHHYTKTHRIRSWAYVLVHPL